MEEIYPIGRSSTAGFMLDNIPFSPYHLAIIAVLGFVGFVEGYDLSITGSLLVLAKVSLDLTPIDIRFVAVASTLMDCVGGFTASAMSDHWSRKLVMQIGVIATTFFTLLIPVQTAEQLIILRLLTGLGAGFAVSAAFPIAAELMPARHRYTYGAVSRCCWPLHRGAVDQFFARRKSERVPADGLAGRAHDFHRSGTDPIRDPREPALASAPRPGQGRGQDRHQIIRCAGSRVPQLSVEALRGGVETIGEELPPYWALFRPGQLRWTVVGVLSAVCAGIAALTIHILLPKALVD